MIVQTMAVGPEGFAAHEAAVPDVWPSSGWGLATFRATQRGLACGAYRRRYGAWPEGFKQTTKGEEAADGR